MALVKQEVKPDVVAFLDADGSDDAQDMSRMIDAIVSGADLVVGRARWAFRTASAADGTASW